MNRDSAGWCIGLMTGTVLDGNIDVAMLRTDGESVFEFGPCVLAKYPASVNELLRETLAAALEWQFNGPEPALFAEAERALTDAQSDAVIALVEDSDVPANDITAVGFHGQSVLHRRPTANRAGRTRQLGDGQRMANQTGLTVVNDFRSNDVAAGGQGAPLAPVYHAALLKRANAGPDTAVLNLGGVANITWCGEGAAIVGFDTGPANAPLNDFIRLHDAGQMDVDGKHAAQGQVDEARLQRLLQHPYFKEPYPKSLDRFDFQASMAEGCTLHNGAALLTAFSAAAVGIGLDLLPHRPERLVACGGGRHNPTMMRYIQQRAGVSVVSADELGWRGDMVEAECFAFLAARRLLNLPISFPGTTGAGKPIVGGEISRPQ